MPVVIVPGDILTYPSNWICHQCNCTTRTSAGLAQQIFNRWVQCNTYERGSQNRKKGNIDVFHVDKDKYVVNMYAQYSTYNLNESKDDRLRWFQYCLNKLSPLVRKGEIVTFPYMIGCGLADGNWDDYKRLIDDFQKGRPDITVYIVRLV